MIDGQGINGMPGNKDHDTKSGIEQQAYRGDSSFLMREQETAEKDFFKKRGDKEERDRQHYHNPDVCLQNCYCKKSGIKSNGQSNSHIHKEDNNAEQDIRSFRYGDETTFAIYETIN